MAPRTPTTLLAATRRFIKAHPGLSESDMPAVTQLVALAKVIDADPTSAALQSQYGTIYRALTKKLESKMRTTSLDPMESALSDLETR